MSVAEILAALTPSALRLAIQALMAILRGDTAKAARKAEEAAHKQAAKLAADQALRARNKKTRRGG